MPGTSLAAAGDEELLLLEALHTRKIKHDGANYRHDVTGDYEIFPASVQQPHPPLYMAAGSDRSTTPTPFSARHWGGSTTRS